MTDIVRWLIHNQSYIQSCILMIFHQSPQRIFLVVLDVLNVNFYISAEILAIMARSIVKSRFITKIEFYIARLYKFEHISLNPID